MRDWKGMRGKGEGRGGWGREGSPTAIAIRPAVGWLPHCPVSQVVGSPDRKGQKGRGGGCCAPTLSVLGPNKPQTTPKAGGGGVAMLSSACSPGSPPASGLQLPSFSAAQALTTPDPGLPAPCQRVPIVSLPTHAEGQQKNVEQELDTFHSSFHRHGCRAWGRGERRGIRTGRGRTSVSVLPAGPRGLPCAAPIPGPSHPETRGQIHVSQPPLLRGWRGVGATAAKPGPAPPPPGPDPRAPTEAGARRPPSARQPPSVQHPLPTQPAATNGPRPKREPPPPQPPSPEL